MDDMVQTQTLLPLLRKTLKPFIVILQFEEKFWESNYFSSIHVINIKLYKVLKIHTLPSTDWYCNIRLTTSGTSSSLGSAGYITAAVGGSCWSRPQPMFQTLLFD